MAVSGGHGQYLATSQPTKKEEEIAGLSKCTLSIEDHVCYTNLHAIGTVVRSCATALEGTRIAAWATHLQVRSEGIRKAHIAREGRENEIPHLDAVRWDHVTEGEVVITQKLWEIMQQYQ